MKQNGEHKEKDLDKANDVYLIELFSDMDKWSWSN